MTQLTLPAPYCAFCAQHMYTAEQMYDYAQRQPLTEEKLAEMFGNGINSKVFREIARMTEAEHSIGAKP